MPDAFEILHQAKEDVVLLYLDQKMTDFVSCAVLRSDEGKTAAAESLSGSPVREIKREREREGEREREPTSDGLQPNRERERAVKSVQCSEKATTESSSIEFWQ